MREDLAWALDLWWSLLGTASSAMVRAGSLIDLLAGIRQGLAMVA